jgi:hypothetical protein
MREQAAIIAAVFIAAMLAVPLFYSEQSNSSFLLAGIGVFAAVPLLLGALQKQPNRSIARASLILFLASPLVYALADPLHQVFERLRDGYFLATSATIIFVSATWLAHLVRTRKWAGALAVTQLLLVAVGTQCIMLWMFIYFE